MVDLIAGVYQVSITDANGCSFEGEYTIAEPAEALNATATITDVGCMGESNGSISLSVSGGMAPYQFEWSNGASTRDLINVIAGVYQLSITDANGCAFAGEYTVTEPSEPLSVTGFASEATCSGEANGNITLSVIGGTPPYQFEWSNGSTSQDQIGIETGSYQVHVRDANACTTSWSGEVLVQAGAVLTGYAQHSNGYILEDEADVVLYEASSPYNHEVASVRTGPDGSFSFTDIPEGQYILYVKLDNHDKQTYHGVMSSYYGNTYKWKEAEIIQLLCEDNEAIVVDMFENPAYTKGNGKAGGKVSHESSLLKIAPFPVIDAQVFLIDEFNGLPVSLITTDENGAYAFSEIAVGDYSIYVDIPGITQQTTHYFSITESDTEQLALDFVVDVVWDMDINSVSNTSIPEIINILNSISIFPNPTNSEYIMLQSSLLNQRELEVVIISEAGSIMLQRDLYVIGGQIKLDLFGFIPGNYILRMKIDSEIQYRKIVVLK